MPVWCLLGRGGVPAQHKPAPSPWAALSCSNDSLRALWCFWFGAFLLSAGATLFRIPGTKLPALFAGLFLPEQEIKSERLSCRTACEVCAVGWMESLLAGASLNHLPPQPPAMNQTPRQTAPPRSCRVYAHPGLAQHCAMKMELSQQPQLLLGSKTIP